MPERYLEADGWIEEMNDEAAERAEQKPHSRLPISSLAEAQGYIEHLEVHEAGRRLARVSNTERERES